MKYIKKSNFSKSELEYLKNKITKDRFKNDIYNMRTSIRRKIRRTLPDYKLILNFKDHTIQRSLIEQGFFRDLIHMIFKRYPSLIESALKLDEVKKYLGTMPNEYEIKYNELISKLINISTEKNKI